MIFGIKPVRIRIKSGGEEHMTLESLLNSFVIEDVVDLLDGRLARWLNQQGHKELAEKIENLPRSDDFLQDEASCIKLTTILFSDIQENKKGSLKAIAIYWQENGQKRNSANLVQSILKGKVKISDKDIIDIAVKVENKELNEPDDFHRDDLLALLESKKEIVEKNLDYKVLYGTLLIKKKKIKEGQEVLNEIIQTTPSSDLDNESIKKARNALKTIPKEDLVVCPSDKRLSCYVGNGKMFTTFTKKDHDELLCYFKKKDTLDLQVYFTDWERGHHIKESDKIYMGFITDSQNMKNRISGTWNIHTIGDLKPYYHDFISAAIIDCLIIHSTNEIHSEEARIIQNALKDEWTSKHNIVAGYVNNLYAIYKLTDREAKLIEEGLQKYHIDKSLFLIGSLEDKINYVVDYLFEIETLWRSAH